MHAWEQIQNSLEYIEEHITEEISIDSLAKRASLSNFYYQRLFKRLVKKPVMEYIKLRRMAKATEELLAEDKRILDVALDLGFASHEQFTRTFKETFGMTPEGYRRKPVILNRMTKPELSLNYTIVDENVPLITDGIVLEIRRTKLLEPEYFTGFDMNVPIGFVSGLGVESGVDPIVKVWEELHNCKESFLNLVSDIEIGVSYPSKKEGYFSYFAGAQTQSIEKKDNLKGWEVTTGEYIVCSFEAENFESLVIDTLYKAQRYLFETWLPNHKIKSQPFSIERYETHDQNTNNMEIWLKLE